MKRTVVFAVLLLVTFAMAQKDEKVTVRVIDRQDRNVPYNYAFATQYNLASSAELVG
jgi:hypothetical protein